MKILCASMPFDGHFSPLTPVAAHLARRGHEVRFYTGPAYADRLAALGVAHVPFARAADLNAQNLFERHPELKTLKGPKLIEAAATRVFFASCADHFDDVMALREDFAFDALVYDGAFFAAYALTKKLGVPAWAIAPAPTPAAPSRSAPPPFFGLTPATNPLARLKHRVVNAMVESANAKGMLLYNALLEREGIAPWTASAFALPAAAATGVFQVGLPEMEFPRDDWPANHCFVGPLLPASPARMPEGILERVRAASTVVLVSQGTIDNDDPEKLLAPTLAALRGTSALVVAATGGQHTAALRQRFPGPDVIVEDWIDYPAVLAHADVFVGNGGYGSVMQALLHDVPIVVAGTNEGKNDINARLAFNGLAIDLKTERPSPSRIARAVATVLGDDVMRERVAKVGAALRAARPLETITARIEQGAIDASTRKAS